MGEAQGGKKSKVCIAFCNGCPRSYVSTAHLSEYFRLNNWEETSRFEEADMVLANGCGVDKGAEQNAQGLINLARKRMHPAADLVVFGCVAATARETLEKDLGAVCLTDQTIFELDDMIGASKKLSEIEDPNLVSEAVSNAWGAFGRFDRIRVKALSLLSVLPPWRWPFRFLLPKLFADHPAPGQERFLIRVAVGCPGICSYCAVRFSYGPLKSKPLDAIRQEFQKGLTAGETLYQLIASDVGAWGADIGRKFPELLRVFFDHSEDFRLIIDDVGPHWLIKSIDEIIEILSGNQEKIEYFTSPIQSGSDRILKAMRRPNTSGEVREAFEKMTERLPGLSLRTHVIVGFPGETDQDFEKTLRLLEEVGFERIHVFPYSDRPNTEAARMPGKISKAIIRRRMIRLRKAFPRSARLMN